MKDILGNYIHGDEWGGTLRERTAYALEMKESAAERKEAESKKQGLLNNYEGDSLFAYFKAEYGITANLRFDSDGSYRSLTLSIKIVVDFGAYEQQPTDSCILFIHDFDSFNEDLVQQAKNSLDASFFKNGFVKEHRANIGIFYKKLPVPPKTPIKKTLF